MRKIVAPTLNFKLDTDLLTALGEWYEKNPGFSPTQLGNLAIRSFISKPYQTEPVTIEYMSKKEFDSFTEKVMETHTDALEGLK